MNAFTTTLSSLIRRSAATKKEERLPGIGPPRLACTSLRSRSGVDRAKALRASKTEFLADMERLPWYRVRCPRFVVTSTRALPGCWNEAE